MPPISFDGRKKRRIHKLAFQHTIALSLKESIAFEAGRNGIGMNGGHVRDELVAGRDELPAATERKNDSAHYREFPNNS